MSVIKKWRFGVKTYQKIDFIYFINGLADFSYFGKRKICSNIRTKTMANNQESEALDGFDYIEPKPPGGRSRKMTKKKLKAKKKRQKKRTKERRDPDPDHDDVDTSPEALRSGMIKVLRYGLEMVVPGAHIPQYTLNFAWELHAHCKDHGLAPPPPWVQAYLGPGPGVTNNLE